MLSSNINRTLVNIYNKTISRVVGKYTKIELGSLIGELISDLTKVMDFRKYLCEYYIKCL